MSKRGRRSKQGNKHQTRREIVYSLKTKILQDSRRDPIYAETIALTSHAELESFGLSMFGEEYYRLEEQQGEPFYSYLERGTVLSDSRGRGCFQK